MDPVSYTHLIHVVDLAVGHVKAIDYIFTNPGLDVINLGTGVGYSVLDMVKAFSKACGKEIPYEIKPRREGDIATVSYTHLDVYKRQRMLLMKKRILQTCQGMPSK